jgi:hypothetical protein
MGWKSGNWDLVVLGSGKMVGSVGVDFCEFCEDVLP